MINKYSELFGTVSDSGTIDTTVLADIRTIQNRTLTQPTFEVR